MSLADNKGAAELVTGADAAKPATPHRALWNSAQAPVGVKTMKNWPKRGLMLLLVLSCGLAGGLVQSAGSWLVRHVASYYRLRHAGFEWLTNLAEYLFFIGPVVAVLWLGLAFFTVGLAFLLYTRWGQYKPLWKCMAMSLLAHLLLADYAAIPISHSQAFVLVKPEVKGFNISMMGARILNRISLERK